jgi:hypothetical protein
LAEGNERLGEVLGGDLDRSALMELAIFSVALAGFTVFYGLERLARRRGALAGAVEPPGVFWLHLGSFCVFNALVAYGMAVRLQSGVAFAILFAVAMALHVLLADRGLEAHYPRRFRRYGRPILAGALLLGWLMAAVVAPSRVIEVALLTAFLAGSVLLSVFKEEVPHEMGSSFGWFVGGLLLYSGLLVLVTHLAA